MFVTPVVCLFGLVWCVCVWGVCVCVSLTRSFGNWFTGCTSLGCTTPTSSAQGGLISLAHRVKVTWTSAKMSQILPGTHFY